MDSQIHCAPRVMGWSRYQRPWHDGVYRGTTTTTTGAAAAAAAAAAATAGAAAAGATTTTTLTDRYVGV